MKGTREALSIMLKTSIVLVLLVITQGQDQINIPDCQHPSADPSDTKEYISEVFLNAGCYKKTTDINDKFLCGWEPNLEHPGIMYTTHYCIENYECYKSNPMNSTSCHIYRKDLLKGHLVTFWVNASNGKKNFTSTIYKFTLENSTKFIPPTNINMSRSASNLTLIWESPSKEAHGSLNEIQYRRCDVQQKHLPTINSCVMTKTEMNSEGAWEIKNNVLEKDVKCKSGGGTKNDNCSVVLDPKEAYRIRVRRRPQNESKGVWSEWSQTVFVPTELQSEPEADIESLSDLTEDGKRLLNLTFKASENLSASLGDLSYIVKIYIKNCQQYHLQKETRHTWYAFNISAAEHEVSIIATNKVGQSPVKTLQIPQANIKAIKIVRSSAFRLQSSCKKYCVEWRDVAADVWNSSHLKIKNGEFHIQMLEGKLNNFTRYHIIFHCLNRNKDYWTALALETYLKENKPLHSPREIRMSEVRKTSALVKWSPLPLKDCRGFLEAYVIYLVDSQNVTTVTNVNSSLSEWKLENLKPNTIYLLDVAARTSEGEGPKHSTEFKTLQFDPGELAGIIAAISLSTLLVAGLCCAAIKKLIAFCNSEVPSPENTSAMSFSVSRKSQVLPPQQAVSASEEATSDIMVIPEVEAMSLLSVDATQTLTKDNESEDLLSDQGSLSESVLVVSQHYAMQSVNQENWEQSEDAEFEEEPVSEEPSDGAATTIYKKGLVLELCHVKN
ncbi:interleukin-6 receptor subunit beta isoform X1 [Polypterus senegalus]|uniref:interleukin-6 receptor subunit beta isoform X1 n=2 Tax=Polypterus senegalus TaxID=55291 RepID=UPI001966085F|nr:interleukin-6 receptor subunit beta isoform X1 [Polypterus senegalus]